MDSAGMSDEPDREAFQQGLDVSNLKPPDIRAFFAGLTSRVVDALSGLEDEAEPAPIAAELTTMADGVANLIAEFADRPHIGGVRRTDVQMHDDAEMETRWRLLTGPVERLGANTAELSGRMADDSVAKWWSDDELVDLARSTVSRVARQLRAVETAVREANAEIEADAGDS